MIPMMMDVITMDTMPYLGHRMDTHSGSNKKETKKPIGRANKLAGFFKITKAIKRMEER